MTWDVASRIVFYHCSISEIIDFFRGTDPSFIIQTLPAAFQTIPPEYQYVQLVGCMLQICLTVGVSSKGTCLICLLSHTLNLLNHWVELVGKAGVHTTVSYNDPNK